MRACTAEYLIGHRKKLPFTCKEDLQEMVALDLPVRQLSCVSEAIFFPRINMSWSDKHGIYTVMFGHKKVQDKRTAKSGVPNLHFYMITPFTTALTARFFFIMQLTFFDATYITSVDISIAGV